MVSRRKKLLLCLHSSKSFVEFSCYVLPKFDPFSFSALSIENRMVMHIRNFLLLLFNSIQMPHEISSKNISILSPEKLKFQNAFLLNFSMNSIENLMVLNKGSFIFSNPSGNFLVIVFQKQLYS